jgi:hypothetical protein
MSVTNFGNQIVNWKYKTPLKGSVLSKMFNGCMNPGIYLRNGEPITSNVGIVFSYSGNQIIIYPFEAVFKASATQTVHIGTENSINLYSDVGLGYVTEASPYITMSYTWLDQILTYIDFSFKSSYTKYDIVIGKAIFTTGVVTSIDYSEATHPPVYNPLTHTLAWAGNLSVTEDLSVAGDVSVAQNLSVTEDLSVAGDVSVAQNLSVTGDTYLKNRDILSISITTADYTLSTAQATYYQILITGVLTGNRNLILPTNIRNYRIICNCTGPYYVVVKTASGTGVYFAPTDIADIYCDGTDVNLIGMIGNTRQIKLTGTTAYSLTVGAFANFGAWNETGDALSEFNASTSAFVPKNNCKIRIQGSVVIGGTGVAGAVVVKAAVSGGNSYEDTIYYSSSSLTAYVNPSMEIIMIAGQTLQLSYYIQTGTGVTINTASFMYITIT